jgi:hypothetical protein
MSARRLTLAALSPLCILAYALGSTPAFAATSSSPVTFATQGPGAGQVDGPRGVSVDQSSGDIYVADSNGRIDKFSASGAFLMAWGDGVADGSTPAPQACGPEAPLPTNRCFPGVGGASNAGAVTSPVSVAVEQSTGDVYAVESSPRLRTEKFDPSGQFLLMFGRDVNATKVAEAKEPGNPNGVTMAEEDLCTAANLQAGDSCGEGKSGTGLGQFHNPTAIAVGPSGDVWVGDENRIEEFNPSGEYDSEMKIEEGGQKGGETIALAVGSSGDLYVKSASLAGVRELSPAGALLDTFDASGSPRALALDAAGDLFIGDATSPYRIIELDTSGVQVEQFGAGQVGSSPKGNALAVGEAAGSLYAVGGEERESMGQIFALPPAGPLITNERVEDLGPTVATLAATVNPEGHAGTYRFEWGSGAGYERSTAITALPGAGFGEEAASAALNHLRPDTTYHFRVLVEDSEGHLIEGPDTAFTTLPAVQIGAQWATEIAATNATVHGELDPLGAPAIWWVQYGSSEGYGSSTPAEGLAAGAGAVPVSRELAGLPPGGVLYYRFVARDEREGVVYTVYGADHTLATQPVAGAFQLPDGRQWEMVSPPNKDGARIDADEEEGGGAQAAAGGGALMWAASVPVGAEVAGSRTLEWSQIYSARGAGGWSSRDIEGAHATADGFLLGNGSEYELFSSDLSLGLVEQKSPTPLAPQATEMTPYLREDGGSSFLPLVTPENVPPGVKFGGVISPKNNKPEGYPQFAGASPDLSHVVLESPDALTSNASSGEPLNLFEWAGGRLALIDVLPDGAVSGAELGGSMNGVAGTIVRHAVSDDGSRVVWSLDGHLYLRHMAASEAEDETIQLDALQPGASGIGQPNAVFQTASSDGSRVFFTDTQELTADSTAETGKPDLYVFEITSGDGEPLKGTLTDLTADAGAGESADVQGLLPGASEDGAYVYLVATGVLSAAASADGEKAMPSADNLYVLHDTGAGWTTGFVAGLSAKDAPDWGLGPAGGKELADLTSRVSPDGRYLAFMSDREPTGYDNHDANSGEADEEVFLYDAEAAGGAGRLICASCNPGGARPVGVHDLGNGSGGSGNQGKLLVDEMAVWEESWLAANIPGWTSVNNNGLAFYQSRYLSDSGRLFFDSSDALVPQDQDGTEDVYEYEPSSVGSCRTSSATFSERSEGCVDLISSGTSGEESAFLDASESGGDVFFLTAAKLAPQAYETSVTVYDAHECAAQSPCTSPPSVPAPCTTPEACRAPSAPQPAIFGAPSSQTFSGAGDLAAALATTVKAKAKPLTRAQKLAKALKACKRRAKRKRSACAARAHRKYGAAKAKQMSGGRQ